MARSYFAFRKDLLGLQPYPNILGPFKARLESGDLGVAFELSGDDVRFLGQSSVESIEEGEDRDGRRVQFITLHSLDQFTQPRLLSVLAGSLERVYRYLTPERHFTRPIIKLSHDDFDAISSNLIDINRSVYRYLFSALPAGLQADFVRRNINSFSLSDKGELTDYKSISGEIINYYDAHITDSMEIISLVAEQLNRLTDVDGLVQPSDFSISDSNGEQVIPFGRVANQVSREYRFNPIFAAREDPLRLIDQARKQITQPQEFNDLNLVTRERTWNDPIF